MASPLSEFSQTYEEFRKQFPRHPLTEELRTRIHRGRYPGQQWLRDNTRKMKDLMSPFWLRQQSSQSE
jgi:hypothetical protein